MKKFTLYFFTILLLILGCSPSTSTPNSLPVVETPKPTQIEIPNPTATPTPIPSGLPDDLFVNGLGIHVHYMFFPLTYFKIGEVDLLQQSGTRIIRDGINRFNISCNGGICDLSFSDRLALRMQQVGIRVMFLLLDEKTPRTAEQRQIFKEFAANAAKHYAGKNIIWQLWGEPDGDWSWQPRSDPEEYILMAEETIAAMREADPDAIITGPGVATLDTVFDDNPWRFLEALGKAGVLAKFDAVNVHLYNGSIPESQIQNLLRLRRLIDKYSPDKKLPIVVGEWGYTPRGEFYKFKATPDEQTKFIPRSFLTHAAHEINLSVYYDWKDDEITPDMPDYEGAFGLTYVSAEPKPGYFALKTLTSILNDHLFVRRLATDSSDDYLLLFRKGNGGVLTAWTTSIPHTVVFYDVANSIDSIQMLGEKKTLIPDNQSLTLELNDEPQYLILPDGFFGNESIFWNPEGTFFRLNSTGQARIPIVVENPSDREQLLNIQASWEGNTIGSMEITLDRKTTKTIQLPVEIKIVSSTMDFFTKISVTNQGNLQTAWIWLQK